MRDVLTKVAIAAAMFGATAFVATGASAQLTANQTAGFAKGKNYTFTYTENYDCVDEPGDDLNFNQCWLNPTRRVADANLSGRG